MHRGHTSFLDAAFTNKVHSDIEDSVFGEDLRLNLLRLRPDSLLKRWIALAGRLQMQGLLQIRESARGNPCVF
jgi:hypothetical protein